MTITLKDIANKWDAHLNEVKSFEEQIAEALYMPSINKKAMVLPPKVERCARIITYRTFKGKLILNGGSYANTVKAYLAIMFATYKKASIIESVGTITADISSLRRDTVDIFYSYYAVYTHKYTEGTYTLEV